jgi:geranylgeranylglycerol-phosphate geranylgeranyltransferase
MTAPSAIASLVRWPNALIAAAGVAVGAWWAGGRLDDARVIAAMVAALGLAAFANTTNDLHDEEIDRVAHPDRPLPGGLISARQAWGVAIAAAAIGLIAATLANAALGALTVVVIAAMYFYSRAFKRFGLPGNLLVAVIASLPFLYGGWAAGVPRASLPLVVLAIPLHLAREIAKDLDDAAADAPTRSTLPVRHGARAARVALTIALLAFCALLVPWVRRWPLFAVLIAPALVMSALGAHRALRGEAGSPGRFKVAMVLAMASLVALRTLQDSPLGPTQ